MCGLVCNSPNDISITAGYGTHQRHHTIVEPHSFHYETSCDHERILKEFQSSQICRSNIPNHPRGITRESIYLATAVMQSCHLAVETVLQIDIFCYQKVMCDMFSWGGKYQRCIYKISVVCCHVRTPFLHDV